MQSKTVQRLLLLALTAVLAACGGGGDSTGPGGYNGGNNNGGNTGGTASLTASVNIASSAFSPGTVTVKQGGTVTWTNNDDVGHTATGNGFDSGLLAKGGTSTHTFATTGTFSYSCTVHPNMTGSVVVVQ